MGCAGSREPEVGESALEEPNSKVGDAETFSQAYSSKNKPRVGGGGGVQEPAVDVAPTQRAPSDMTESFQASSSNGGAGSSGADHTSSSSASGKTAGAGPGPGPNRRFAAQPGKTYETRGSAMFKAPSDYDALDDTDGSVYSGMDTDGATGGTEIFKPQGGVPEGGVGGKKVAPFSAITPGKMPTPGVDLTFATGEIKSYVSQESDDGQTAAGREPQAKSSTNPNAWSQGKTAAKQGSGRPQRPKPITQKQIMQQQQQQQSARAAQPPPQAPDFGQSFDSDPGSFQSPESPTRNGQPQAKSPPSDNGPCPLSGKIDPTSNGPKAPERKPSRGGQAQAGKGTAAPPPSPTAPSDSPDAANRPKSSNWLSWLKLERAKRKAEEAKKKQEEAAKQGGAQPNSPGPGPGPPGADNSRKSGSSPASKSTKKGGKLGPTGEKAKKHRALVEKLKKSITGSSNRSPKSAARKAAKGAKKSAVPNNSGSSKKKGQKVAKKERKSGK